MSLTPHLVFVPVAPRDLRVSRQARSPLLFGVAPRLPPRRAYCPVRACGAASSPSPPVSDRVRDFLQRAEEGAPLDALARADAAYTRLRAPGSSTQGKGNQIVFGHDEEAPVGRAGVVGDTAALNNFDVVVAGGTLGIFVALALQIQGWRCAVVEKGRVVGRTQEWNISRAELRTLLDVRLITENELEEVIVSSWNPSRIAFARARDEPLTELFVRDVLNCGVSPCALIAIVRRRFEALGGVCVENAAISRIDVYSDCVMTSAVAQGAPLVDASYGAGGLGLQRESSPDAPPSATVDLRARLLVDAMGSFSPIAAQARGGTKPDAVCVTVGACCEGEFSENTFGDVICAIDPIDPNRSTQYFWEAFPADGSASSPAGGRRSLRTTYMFAYGACEPSRPSLAETLDDYLSALPRYQGLSDVGGLVPKRILFGFFPAWKGDPRKPSFDRVFPVGDAGGLQSPISFGGFGCICRHLPRISRALNEALASPDDCLLKRNLLAAATPYMPNLAITWLFNRFMSCRPGKRSVDFLDEYGINKVLLLNMTCMQRLGADVQVPFLQDVITAGALTRTLFLMTASDPLLAFKLIPHIGILHLIEWLAHYIALLSFATLGGVASKLSVPAGALNERQRYELARAVEAWEYGSGQDHSHSTQSSD